MSEDLLSVPGLDSRCLGCDHCILGADVVVGDILELIYVGRRVGLKYLVRIGVGDL
jgi:hypothetical protein